uniref:Uncharacterized protein n=1 Tax=Panagrolaimus sp. PS1159 TaxID=55785 RepID=A0AC35ERW1_9BILA
MAQNFTLRRSMMSYVIATANPKVAIKLYKACKYFPAKFNLLIVDRLRHTFRQDVLSFGEDTINVDREDVDSYKNLWIAEQFISVTNDIRLSTWISNISRCTIYHLEIRARHLTFNEFKILTEAGTVEHIEINKVYYENRTQVPLDVIMSHVPKATFIVLFLFKVIIVGHNFLFSTEYTHVTPYTMKILAETEREFKIGYCSLRDIDGMIDDEDYYQFMRVRSLAKLFF